jgi:general secretion pathway protein G
MNIHRRPSPHQPETRRHRSRGFTLIELLVVLVILGLLAGIVGPNVFNQLGGAKGKTAAVQIKDLQQAADLYRLDIGRYPTNGEGLDALVSNPDVSGWNGPYLRGSLPEDPWGNPYRYEAPGRYAEVDIFSYGADNAPGGDGENADVGNWE